MQVGVVWVVTLTWIVFPCIARHMLLLPSDRAWVRPRLPRVLAAAWAVTIVLPTVSPAQAGRTGRTFRIEVDNDLFALRGGGRPADYDYTHGTHLALEQRRAPSWTRRLAGLGPVPGCDSAAGSPRDCLTTVFGVGQDIYTPRHDSPVPVPGDRPYAGWLFASGAVRRISGAAPGARVRTWSAAAGVVGPPALAAQVQNGIHRLLHNRPELGWAHQLATEPGLMLAYDDARLSSHAPGSVLTRVVGGDAALQTSWSYGAALGNVRTGVHAGATGWVGLGEHGTGGASVPYAARAAPERDPPMRLYLVGGIRGDVVLHSIFLDGNTFVPSVRAVRRPLVWESEGGIGIRGRHLSAEYRLITSGIEYAGERSPHAYGAIRVAVRGW